MNIGAIPSRGSLVDRLRSLPPASVARFLVIAAAVIIAGMVAPLFGGGYVTFMMAQVGALAVAVIGYNLVVGEAGLFSLGHAAFMGVGVYAYIVAAGHGVATSVALLLSLLVTLIAAAAIGLITLRLKDVYFAIGTFCAAGIVQNVLTQLTGLTGGDQGAAVPPLSLFGLTLGGAEALYPWIIASVIAAVGLHEWIASSSFGRKLRCMRDDEEAASAMGISLVRYRLAVFLIGACFAAWGGWLYALSLQYVDPSILGVDQTVLILVMLVIGGTGSVTGALIGATLILLTPQLLQPLARWWQFTYGFVVIASVIVGRRGLSGIGSEAIQLVVRRFVPSRNQDAVGRTTTDGWEYYSIHSDSQTGSPRALRVRKVTKTFGGVTALQNVDVELQPGVVHAIIGPNGSGKSTLVNVITGLLAPSSGGVSFGAGDLTSKSPDYISRLGVVRTFQTPRLFLQVSVMDNVLPMAELAGYRGRAARIQALRCLAMVGLKHDAQQSARDLPQGHRRLLEIARALALGPKVFLLDEPAAGLAEAEWNELKSLLRKLAAEGMSVAVIEHNMPFVLAVADKITVLQLGRVLAEGSPAEIQTNPIVRSAYMGNVVETAV